MDRHPYRGSRSPVWKAAEGTELEARHVPVTGAWAHQFHENDWRAHEPRWTPMWGRGTCAAPTYANLRAFSEDMLPTLRGAVHLNRSFAEPPPEWRPWVPKPQWKPWCDGRPPWVRSWSDKEGIFQNVMWFIV